MTFFSALKALAIYLPELVKLLARLGEAIEQGVEAHVIRKKFEAIDKAFLPNQPASSSAGQLDDIFRGIK